MTKLLKLFPLLILFTLAACDENKQKPKSGTENFPQTAKTLPEFVELWTQMLAGGSE